MNESDMRNFFEQVVTNFVSLSDQARELEAVKVNVAGLNNKLNEYVNENERINRSAHEAWELVTMLEKEKAELAKTVATFEKEREEYDTEITNQNNLIGQYSNDLHEANTKITQLEEDKAILQGHVRDGAAALSNLTSRISGLEYDNNTLTNDRDYWKRQYHASDSTISEYQSRVSILSTNLREAEDQLAKIKAVFMGSPEFVGVKEGPATAPAPISEPTQNVVNF